MLFLKTLCRRSHSTVTCLLTTATTTTAATTSKRCLSNTRREFEDALHIGRACSRFKIDDKQVQHWKKKLGKVQPLHLVVPDDLLMSPAKYEIEALQQIHERSYDCNVLLEIRDVRVPASSHHPSFTRLADHRLHLICYTHADVIDQATRDRVEQWTLKSWPESRSIFVDTRESRPFGPPKSKEKEDQQSSDASAEAPATTPPATPFDLMYDSLLDHLENRGGLNSALTVGVANTGKSSLLMALLRTARARGDLPKSGLKAATPQSKTKKKKKTKKKRTVAKVMGAVAIQDKPGKTREITEYLLREKPRAFFLDVPGMTPPPFFFRERPEAWFAFGAANLLPLGRNVENDLEVLSGFCQYILYAMNRDSNFGYVAKLGLDAPTTDLTKALDAFKPFREDKRVDREKWRLQQCKSFLKLFNTGNFGSVILDDLRKPYQRFVFKDSHFKKKKQSYRSGFGDGDESDEEDDGGGGGDDDDDDDEDDFYRTR